MNKITIIGSGPAGYTAAIYASRAGLSPVLYTGIVPGGQLTETTDVDNFPGFNNGITGNDLMENMRLQAERFGTKIINDIISSVDLESNPKKLFTDSGNMIESESVIISTGASAKWLGLENETRLRLNAGGVSACATCDGFFFTDKLVAVVGGGDTALEEALYLSRICRKVYLLVRSNSMRASHIMQERAKNTKNIEILYNSKLIDIIGPEYVERIEIETNGNRYSQFVDGVFIAIGHKPNTDIFKSLDMDELGYIKTFESSTKTSIPGVFAVGDCVDKIYRQAVTAAGSGCMGALDAERWIGHKLQ
jgi:thioredoxin reductase (NADPH)